VTNVVRSGQRKRSCRVGNKIRFKAQISGHLCGCRNAMGSGEPHDYDLRRGMAHGLPESHSFSVRTSQSSPISVVGIREDSVGYQEEMGRALARRPRKINQG
jgi:hypothetical protein